MKNITMHILNSVIAGLLVFFGASISELTDHGFSQPSELCLGLVIGLITGIIMFLTKLQVVLNAEEQTIKFVDFV